MTKSGWKGESQRHSMAKKGIRTSNIMVETYHEGGNKLLENNEILIDMKIDIENILKTTEEKLSGKRIVLTENGIVVYDLYIPIIPFEFETWSGFKGTAIAQYERQPMNFMESQGEIDYSLTSYRIKWEDGRIEEGIAPEHFDKYTSSKEILKKSHEQYKISKKKGTTKKSIINIGNEYSGDYLITLVENLI